MGEDEDEDLLVEGKDKTENAPPAKEFDEEDVPEKVIEEGFSVKEISAEEIEP